MEGETTGPELNPFLMLTFADLKKYRYWYWCGFPALLQKPGWAIEGELQPMEAAMAPDEVQAPSDRGREDTDHWLPQVLAIHSRQTTTEASFSLAKPSTSGAFEFGALSTFATFFEGVPTSSVRPL